MGGPFKYLAWVAKRQEAVSYEVSSIIIARNSPLPLPLPLPLPFLPQPTGKNLTLSG